MQTNCILSGDCLDKLRELPDDSIDLIVTDPPYGIKFLAKAWDLAVPSVDIWKECLRVLKPGAFAFIMSSPRQDVLCQMIINLRDAGFSLDFTSMTWVYASGMPKAINMSKAIDRHFGCEREVVGFDESKYRPNRKSEKDGADRVLAGGYSSDNGATITKPHHPIAERVDGAYSFHPKPAMEFIIVAQKPISEKTLIEHTINWYNEREQILSEIELELKNVYGLNDIKWKE